MPYLIIAVILGLCLYGLQDHSGTEKANAKRAKEQANKYII